MRRLNLSFVRFTLLLLLVACSGAELNAGNIRVTTWNLQWFPTGSPKKALSEEEEATRIEAAAKVLREINPDVLLLQEVRDWAACEKLGQAIAPGAYQVLVCSTFREGLGTGGPVGKQQVAILSKHPGNAAWTEPWKLVGAVDPPRGFAFAAVQLGSTLAGFYNVHLKSNVAMSGNKERQEQLNILKREFSAQQLAEHMRAVEEKLLPGVKAFVVGGDFNTNVDEPLFVSEGTLRIFREAGLSDPYEGMTRKERITHPAEGGYPAATFDYLLFRGLKLLDKPKIVETKASDHLPVTCEFEVP